MISVIIPIYNAERFLAKCLDSVLRQNYRDIEVICVNDASPDNCSDILQKYASSDSRIRCVSKQKNEGVDQARFDGLRQAQGKSVFFLDADDWLADNTVLEHLAHLMQTYQVDYVETGVYRCMDERGLIKKAWEPKVTGLIRKPELFDKYYLSFFGKSLLSVNIWGKLYKKATLEKADIQPSGYKMGEDLVFNLQLFPHLDSIYISDRIGYCYRYGGMTSRYNPKLLSDLKNQFLLKESLIEQYGYDQATPFARVEMKNVLRSYICQRLIYTADTPESLLQQIDQEIHTDFWDRITDVPEGAEGTDEPFFPALREKDSKRMLQICQEQVDKGEWNRKIKQLATSHLKSTSNYIPKTIHYCWFGGKEKPARVLECIDSWKRQCPDYKIREWNESNSPISQFPFAQKAYEAKQWAFVGDVIRLYALYNYGGIYLDTDTELLKPLDSLLQTRNFCSYEEGSESLQGALLGAEKGDKWIEEFLGIYGKVKFPENEVMATALQGNRLLTDFMEDKVVPLDGSYVSTDYITLYPAEEILPLYQKAGNGQSGNALSRVLRKIFKIFSSK